MSGGTHFIQREMQLQMDGIFHGISSKMGFFLYTFCGMFVYFCGYSGLGLNPISSFDYNVLSFEGDPLINPFFTMVNYGSSGNNAHSLWVSCVQILDFCVNSKADLPIKSNGVFNNTGESRSYIVAVCTVTFWVQLISTFVSTFICVGVLDFQLPQIPDVCALDASLLVVYWLQHLLDTLAILSIGLG
ncbi:hypothetical protein EDD18DRAFT_1375436 [Armillaria luteobubalina]|uniref:Uncharacterized protein n=1 Tax=Armillaria luteobubalina TaxID=153913 RepID=A0AA39U349_9AGAR|nr:hypothetical protein EDD18DRAFT_1375436 [Armillaria luteobubalina]